MIVAQAGAAMNLEAVGKEAEPLQAHQFLEIGVHKGFQFALIDGAAADATGDIAQDLPGIDQTVCNPLLAEPLSRPIRIAIGGQTGRY